MIYLAKNKNKTCYNLDNQYQLLHNQWTKSPKLSASKCSTPPGIQIFIANIPSRYKNASSNNAQNRNVGMWM